jgi:hypothetical protein
MRRFPAARRALVAAALVAGLSGLSMDPALAKTVPLASHDTAACSHASHAAHRCVSHRARYWRRWRWRR